MLNKFFLYLKNLNWILFAVVLLLICFGLIEIYSIALGQGDAEFTNFKKQAGFAILGLTGLFFFAFLDYHFLRSFSKYFLLAGFLLLLLVLFFGTEIRGTRGWFYLGGLGFQPVEIAKVFLILFLAWYFSSVALKVKPLKHLIITGLVVFVYFLLVALQPDFGSALILFFVWISMVMIAGFKFRYLAAIFLVIILLGIGTWNFYFQDYQKQRVKTFFNPAQNSLDQGYNITQAIIAVGSGGMTGRGIGFGSQSQLKFLPESHNDFIFAVIAEESGLLGVLLVLFFFAILFYQSLKSVKKVNNDFGIFFIMGAACLIFIEMFINISMNIGLLPVIGISLPFVSYGGSVMVSHLVLIGIIESIIIRSRIRY